MKRILTLLLAAAMLLSVSGCGSITSIAETAYAGQLSDRLEVAGDTPDTLDANLLNYAAALATYPEAVPYPNEEDYLTEKGELNMEAYTAAYESWTAAQIARPSVPEDAAKLNTFFSSGVKQFLSGSGNKVCSPINVYMALAMLAEVTGGESRAQILKLLNAENIDALRTQAKGIWESLYLDDGTSTRIMGSSVWMNEQVKYKEDTLQRLAKNYYTSSFSGTMGSDEYNAALQGWLNEQTRGLLEKQASGAKLTADTILALAATLYFKAPWTNQFNPSLTSKQTFHAPAGDVQADFMHDTFTGILYKGMGFTAVSLPLAEGSMWLLLPEEGKTPASLLENGAAMDFLAAPGEKGTPARAKIVLSLPKFDVSSDLSLNSSLQALGIKNVFNASSSDFTPLTDTKKIAVSKVQHAARVKIDEEGCEAAAYTLMMVETTAMMEEPPTVEFNLNRPFLFCVTAERNLPLFLGVVQNPA